MNSPSEEQTPACTESPGRAIGRSKLRNRHRRSRREPESLAAGSSAERAIVARSSALALWIQKTVRISAENAARN
jgi:hypothetical protein